MNQNLDVLFGLGLQCVNRVRKLLERIVRGHERFEVDLSSLEQIHRVDEILRHVIALDDQGKFAPVEQWKIYLEHGLCFWCGDQNECASGEQRIDSRVDGGFRANRIVNQIELRIPIFDERIRLENIGRTKKFFKAKLGANFAALLEPIHQCNSCCTHRSGHQSGQEANRARTDDDDSRTGFGLATFVDVNRNGSRFDQCAVRVTQTFWHGQELVGTHQHFFGKASRIQINTEHAKRWAMVDATLLAGTACSAADARVDRHPSSGLEADVWSNAFDHTDALVTGNDGEFADGIVARDQGDIVGADSGGDNPNDHLTVTVRWVGRFDQVDGLGLWKGDGFHGAVLAGKPI